MVRFIYGESGYGKTHRIIELLAEDYARGVHSFLIVPEQAAVASERAILNSLPPEAQLGIEVLSFSRLYNRVCREYGGLEYNYITKPAKYLMMWKTLGELSPMLEHYSLSQGNDSSMGDFMLNAILEFKANGISAHDIESASEKLDRGSEFYSKLRDLSLIYSAYTALVSQNFSDSSDNISKLFDILQNHNFFNGSNVYIDGFTSFTSPEHKVMGQIFRQADSATVAISLPCIGFSSIYTASISASEKKLRDIAGKGAISEILPENKRTQSNALEFISKNILELSSAPLSQAEDDGSIKLEMCVSPYAAAEAAARWARTLMQEGYRCRDIIVIMRDAENYRGIIEPAFETNEVPFFFSEKSDLCSKPSVKFLLSALQIYNNGWRTSDVISHLKTQIYDLPERNIDLFETYVNTWSIKGNMFTDGKWTMNPDGYSEVLNDRGREILCAANEVREYLCERLIPFFTRLSAAENASEMCRAIYGYILDSNVENALEALSKKCASENNIKEAKEYAALYQTTLDALALVTETLEDEDITVRELCEALRLVFEKTEIGTIPTSVDEVMIGSASTIRADNPKCAIVLGLCEGEFPKKITESGALSSPERNMLSTLGIELSSEDTASSDELMFVKKAFSLPSDKLILLSSLTENDSRATQPSLPYFRVKKLLPHIVEHQFDENDISYLCISPYSAARYMHTQPSDAEYNTLSEALFEISNKYKTYCEQYFLPQLNTKNCRISPEDAKKLFPNKMTLSQSKLEKYVKCNFHYYCSDILKLREEKKAKFGSLDIGTFIHYILENLIKNIVNENGVKDISDDELAHFTDKTVEHYLDATCPSFVRNSGRSRHLYMRLRNLSLLLAKNIMGEFSSSRFTPAFFELNIKKGSLLEPLEIALSDGGTVSLAGIIDRVDILKENGKTYIRVVDYKTGNKAFSRDELAMGLNTQLLIYLFTLCSESSRALLNYKGEVPTPAGMVYLSSNIPTIELDDYTETDEILAKAEQAFKRSGLLLNDSEILRAMNENMSTDFLAEVKVDKKGLLSGKALTSSEEFFELRKMTEEVIGKIAEDMRRGSACASPLIIGQTSPCDYCEMRPVCKIKPE